MKKAEGSGQKAAGRGARPSYLATPREMAAMRKIQAETSKMLEDRGRPEQSFREVFAAIIKLRVSPEVEERIRQIIRSAMTSLGSSSPSARTAVRGAPRRK